MLHYFITKRKMSKKIFSHTPEAWQHNVMEILVDSVCIMNCGEVWEVAKLLPKLWVVSHRA